MCKANSHTEDSNAKTLPNSCLGPRDSCPKTAESMLESRDIHARRRRFSCPNSTKSISKHRENHAQKPQNSRRNPNRALSLPTESRADSASLLRIPNAQRARGMVFDDAEPAPRRASPHRATSHHHQLPSRASAAPNRIAVAGRYRRLLSHNAASPSKTTGKRIASPTTGRRRCDSESRSFLCAQALPRRQRLQFRAANEFSWWRQSMQHRKTT